MQTIKFKAYGNMCLVEALKQLHVATLFHPATQLYIATFDESQTDLYECARKILARRVAATLQKQA